MNDNRLVDREEGNPTTHRIRGMLGGLGLNLLFVSLVVGRVVIVTVVGRIGV